MFVRGGEAKVPRLKLTLKGLGLSERVPGGVGSLKMMWKYIVFAV